MEETSIAKLEAQKNELKTKPKTKSNISKINHIKSTINRIYREDKAQILEFEQNNYRYLALIRSTNGYYKLTHHSALFYSRDLAPKLNLSANLQPDGDFQSVSSIGIVSIADIDAFSKNLRKLKATRVKTKNNTGNIIIFKLPWEYSEKQLSDFLQDNAAKNYKFNKIILTENVIPALYVKIVNLTSTIYENTRKMKDDIPRRSFGYDAINAVTNMNHAYLGMANGHLDKLTSLRKIKTNLRFVKYQTKILADLKIWPINTCARIGELIVDIQDIINQEERNL